MEIFCIFWMWEVIMKASDAELNGANGTKRVNWTLVITRLEHLQQCPREVP